MLDIGKWKIKFTNISNRKTLSVINIVNLLSQGRVIC